MTFPTAPGSTALAPSNTGATSKESLNQSREAGEVVLHTVRDGNVATRQKALEIKPWAHLVAGGLVLMLQSLLTFIGISC